MSKIIPAAIAQTIVNLMIIVSGVIIFCGFMFATDRFGDLMLYIARFKGGILGNFTMLNGMGIVLGIVFWLFVCNYTNSFQYIAFIFSSFNRTAV